MICTLPTQSVSICLVLLWMAPLCGAEPGGEENPVDFRSDIRPILTNKCFQCHGPDEATREGGLRLDLAESAWGEADSGERAIVPGDPDDSELVRRILAEDDFERMPPPETKNPLTEREKELLIRWIRSGAEFQRHWSWEPIHRPPLPSVRLQSWVRQPLDRFILAKLEAKGMSPSDVADRYRLVRRVTLDLTGLPPTLEEVDRFAADESPDAYEQLVERLLASPAFGERMAWGWLDAARYADSNGYQGDGERTMWPWRDWVVQALNENLPFDQFSIWQVAGDLLPEATFQQKLATGFLRNHMINGEGGRIAEENRVEYVMDMTETVGTVWLGLTLNCCRCHDHKFDALSQADYFSFFAFFNQTPVDGSGGNPQTPPVLEAPTGEQRGRRGELAELIRRQAEVIQKEEESLGKLLETPAARRSPDDLRGLEAFLREKSAGLAAEVRKLREAREEQNALNRAVPRVMVMEDREEKRPTHVLKVGLYNQPEQEVSARVPESLPTLQRPAEETPNRLDLAGWLFDQQQPLTARVTANRLWQEFFGIGLVKTSEDFGIQGELPSHPELLDWLAHELIDSAWDVKHFCRMLVTSATYRQSSRVTEEAWELDPENRWLSRAPRYRLPAWMLRDQALAVSGLLVPRMGGPSVQPYQPPGVWEEATFGRKSYRQDSGDKLYRRSLYTFWRRIIAPTNFFDNASRQVCVVNPSRTNTPLHALTTMNDITFIEAGRHLAERVLQEEAGEVDSVPDGAVPDGIVLDEAVRDHATPNNASQVGDRHADDRQVSVSKEGVSETDRAERQVTRLFCLVLGRYPEPAERDILATSLRRLERQFGESPEEAERFLSVGDSSWNRQLDPVRLAALAACANGLLNLDETLTKE
jgi:hypothetical protein